MIFVQYVKRYDIFLTLLVSKFSIFSSSNFSQYENIEFISWTKDVLKFCKFKFFKFLQFLNVSDISDTFEVSKFVRDKLVNEIHDWNKPDISNIFLVLKLIKSKDVILLHPENIYEISSTLSVLKLINFNEFKVLQSLNIFDIFFAFFVLKLLKLILIKEWHPSKIPEKSVTLSVLNFDILIYSNLLQFLNILDIFLTLEVSKLYFKSKLIKFVLWKRSFIYSTFDKLKPSFLKLVKFKQLRKEPFIDIIFISCLEYNSTLIKDIISLNI